jgi:GT2 family glycosyltransferase
VEAFAQEAAGRRVVYVRHEKNQGLGATRNTAMGLARGEFLALLDADDIWMETHLAATLAALEEQQADIAYSTVVKFEDGTNRLLGLWGPSPKELAGFPAGLVRRNFITPSSAVLRRRVIEAVGRFDTDPDVHMCEDLDYWLRSVEAGMKFVHVPGCHCLYRKGAPGAGSGNLCNIVEHHAAVLAKHVGKAGIAARTWRRHLAWYQAAAGMLNLEDDARRAGPWFFKAWRTQPVRLDLLTLSLLCRTILPWLPQLGIVRRINRIMASR